MSILITGGCGYIGLALLEDLSRDKFDLVAYDLNIPSTNILNLYYRIDLSHINFVKGDVLDLYKILDVVKRFNVEYIIHTATMLTRESEENPPKAFKVNVEGTLNILEVARIMDISKIVLTSSEAVYGITENTLIEEEYPKRPITIYGVTKLAAEYIGLKYSELYGIDFVALRLPMIYGFGLSFTGTRPINFIIESAIRKEQPRLQFRGDMKIEPLYIADAVQAIKLALKTSNPKSKIYNIGIGKIYTLAEICNIIRNYVPTTQCIFGDDPGLKIYPVQGPLSIKRACEELGYQPCYTLEKGILETVKKYKQIYR